MHTFSLSLQYYHSSVQMGQQCCQPKPEPSLIFEDPVSKIVQTHPQDPEESEVAPLQNKTMTQIQQITLPEIPPKVQTKLEQLGDFPYPQRSKIEKQQEKQQQRPKAYRIKNDIYFVGQTKNDKMNGKGILYLPDKSVMLGYIKDSELVNRCRVVYENGDYFEGSVEDNVANGKGVYSEGDYTYKGHFKNNLPHGRGEQQCATSTFEGNFYNGQKSEGTYIWKEGQKLFQYKGEFKNNYFDGKGTLKNDTGVYRGDFVKGLKEGQGKFTWQNNFYYVGEYKADVKHGLGTLYDDKGEQIRYGRWVNDRPADQT